MRALRREEAGCGPRGTQKWSFPVCPMVYTGPSDTCQQQEANPQHPDPRDLLLLPNTCYEPAVPSPSVSISPFIKLDEQSYLP